jgi:hypothetical protein
MHRVTHSASWDVPNPNGEEVLEFAIGASSREPRMIKMQRHGRPPATAIIAARLKEIGPAGEMAERSPRSGEKPRTNGNRAKPR